MPKASALFRLVGIALLLVPAVLFAQQPASVGDLLEKGGRKLTKEELATLLTGAVLHRTQSGTGVGFEMTHNADGSVKGKLTLTNGQEVGVAGKWSVTDKGQYCRDCVTTSGSRIKGCTFIFALDNTYYESSSDEKMSALVVREVEKN